MPEFVLLGLCNHLLAAGKENLGLKFVSLVPGYLFVLFNVNF